MAGARARLMAFAAIAPTASTLTLILPRAQKPCACARRATSRKLALTAAAAAAAASSSEPLSPPSSTPSPSAPSLRSPVPRARRKLAPQKRYWLNVRNLTRELRAFQKATGLPRDRLPTENELRKHVDRGGLRLSHAFTHYGGKGVVAERLGFRAETAHSRRTTRLLAERLRAEVAEVAARAADTSAGSSSGGGGGGDGGDGDGDGSCGTANSATVIVGVPTACGVAMPAPADIRSVSPTLMNRISAVPGGYSAVARLLGYQVRPAPNSPPPSTATTAATASTTSSSSGRRRVHYWNDERNLRAEIAHFMSEHACWRRALPTQRMFVVAGRADIARAVQRYGGSDAVAARLGLHSSTDWLYFTEFFDIVRELKGYLRQRRRRDRQRRELWRHGDNDDGCEQRSAADSQTDSVTDYHDDDERVDDEQMPGIAELRQCGRTRLAKLVARHGGASVLAARLGVRPPRHVRRTDLRWGEFSLVYALRVLHFCEEYGAVADGAVQLPPLDAMPWDLHALTLRYGGADLVARRLGLTPPPPPPPPPPPSPPPLLRDGS